MELHIRRRNQATLLTTCLKDPAGYGRILRNEKGEIKGIVEEREATSTQKKIKEVNGGVYCFQAPELFHALYRISRSPVKGEYYLTDVIALLRKRRKELGVLQIPDSEEIIGVNTRRDMVRVRDLIRYRILDKLMLSGITVVDPSSTTVEPGVSIGRDTVLYPQTLITGETRIGQGCHIGPFTLIQKCQVGNRVKIRASFLYESRIRHDAEIGPFTHLRPGSSIDERVRVGNFCEVKNSRIGRATKMSHLSYLGDAIVGEKVNIGAGVITCNYDGVKKYRTTIGNQAFIGSDVQFIAPVRIGKKAYIAAGSTITENVPSGKLAIARSRQVIKKMKK